LIKPTDYRRILKRVRVDPVRASYSDQALRAGEGEGGFVQIFAEIETACR